MRLTALTHSLPPPGVLIASGVTACSSVVLWVEYVEMKECITLATPCATSLPDTVANASGGMRNERHGCECVGRDEKRER
eukprot:2969395-Rhodomonas_salina.1